VEGEASLSDLSQHAVWSVATSWSRYSHDSFLRMSPAPALSSSYLECKYGSRGPDTKKVGYKKEREAFSDLIVQMVEVIPTL